MIEDTIVQVRDRAGTGWTDYARTTRAEALAALEAGKLPGHSKSEPLRAVDWITKEEVTMTTRTATRVAAEKVAETKARSDANGRAEEEAREAINEIVDKAASEKVVAELRKARASGTTLAELKKAHPDLSAATIRAAVADSEPKTAGEKAQRASAATRTVTKPKHGDPGKVQPKGGRKGLSTRRVAPVEPDYSKLPAAKRAEAKRTYKAALAEFEAGEPQKVVIPKQPPSKPARAAAKAAEAKAGTKATDPKASDAKKPRTKLEGFDASSRETIAKVVKLHTDGKTMKQIAEAFGLPAEHRSWYAVSMVWRREADARGLDRPRRSKEAAAK